MFDDAAQARQALAAYFDPPRLERVVSALVPAIVFAPVTSGAAGGSRIGGAPDMAPGAEWPRPAPPADPEAIAGRGSPDAAKEMRDHFAKNLPYAFFAQVDLGEAARLGPVASALPSEGRLLFFYDLAAGPWDTGARVARVVWDTTPADLLKPLAAPDDLKAVADADRGERVKLAEEFGDDVAAARNAGSAYDAPGRPMRLKATLRLPNVASVEIDALPEIAEAARSVDSGSDFAEAYGEAVEANHDGSTEEKWRRQQLLGSPQSEQDDPRYDAVVATTFGKQHLEREEWLKRRGEIMSAARDWTLLLQVDVGDWMQQRFTEGTVYFVIRKDDLAARRFDRVLAVYQQT